MKRNTGPNPISDQSQGHRPVRSFVLREGRLTQGQRRALERLWPVYGIENTSEVLDLDQLFGRASERHLEIGFGMGEALAWSAAQSPEQDFIGIEVHRPGVGSLLRQIESQELSNVRIICADAVEVLQLRIVPESLSSIRLFFPDPWPKKRHHKRRIVQPSFVSSAVGALRGRGIFHLATDWEPYAAHMLSTLSSERWLENTAGDQRFAERPDWRKQTKFETRGLRLGHGVWDLIFRRRA